MMDYKTKYQSYLTLCEEEIERTSEQYLPQKSSVATAARYSLLSGGKRVRAVLVLAVCDMLGGNMQAAAHFAAAIEMVHCYSLIHDDLPCMDNDDMRRGKPSCHKAFDEATALLAGDLLLTEAFEVLASTPTDPATQAKGVLTLANAAGSTGMIYGQELDLYYEAVQASEQELQEIHHNKTGALINAAVQLGATAGGADSILSKCLETYAFALGLVFQMVDDVLDETSTTEELGKPIGSDRENGKTTFVTLYGVEGTMNLASEINKKNCDTLMMQFGEKSRFLVTLAENLLVRRN